MSSPAVSSKYHVLHTRANTGTEHSSLSSVLNKWGITTVGLPRLPAIKSRDSSADGQQNVW